VARSFGMSEEDMANIDVQLPFLRRQMERSDEFAAQVALSVLKDLEAGDGEAAKVYLGKTLSVYYNGHFSGNTNFVARIERFAATNAALSNAIYRALK
jgi:hypothetical protein